MSGNRPLIEVPEAAASGRLAEVYADIRKTLGLPLVNLIYRHLASEPGRLERLWAAVAARGVPPASNTFGELRTLEVTWVTPLPVPVLEGLGVDESWRRAARGTLSVYERANGLNGVIVTRLVAEARGEALAPGPGNTTGAAPPIASGPRLPMADIDGLPPERLAVLREVSRLVVGGPSDVIVPSLFRHFADHGPILSALWLALSTAESRASLQTWPLHLEKAAERDAATLGEVGAALDPETIQALERFRAAIARMLAAGRILEAFLNAVEP